MAKAFSFILFHYSSTSSESGLFNSDSISWIKGKFVLRFSGIAFVSQYSDTPIGLLISRSEYSAITLSLDLQRSKPIVGLSCSDLT
jgi:hypothetical protein